jgi:hypothetical protein
VQDGSLLAEAHRRRKAGRGGRRWKEASRGLGTRVLSSENGTVPSDLSTRVLQWC